MDKTEAGIGLGVVAAMILSFHHNHSIIWMVLHSILSWVYVIWYALFL